MSLADKLVYLRKQKGLTQVEYNGPLVKTTLEEIIVNTF